MGNRKRPPMREVSVFKMTGFVGDFSVRLGMFRRRFSGKIRVDF